MEMYLLQAVTLKGKSWTKYFYFPVEGRCEIFETVVKVSASASLMVRRYIVTLLQMNLKTLILRDLLLTQAEWKHNFQAFSEGSHRDSQVQKHG